MRTETSGKEHTSRAFLIMSSAVILLVTISSVFAWPDDRAKQAGGSPATQALARLKEARYYSSQPPPGAAIIGSQSYALEKVLPAVLRDLGLRWEPDPRLATFCRWLNELYEVDFRPDSVAINEAASGWACPSLCPIPCS